MDFTDLYHFDGIHENSEVANTYAIYERTDELTSVIRTMLRKRLSEEQIRGKRVLLKPNWVRENRKPLDYCCLRTHENIVLAVLKIVLEYQPELVTLGDAPLQESDFSKCTDSFVEEIKRLTMQFHIPIKLLDFRKIIWHGASPAHNSFSSGHYLIFDLKNHSVLEAVSKKGMLFRVTNYDPRRLQKSHQPGMHQYCVAREYFEHDFVMTLPKVKTHQKTGLTNALKILVGINGDKDYLPHHRVGGTGNGGDCYPGKNIFVRLAERLFDFGNMTLGTKWQKIFYRAAYSVLHRSGHEPQIIEGGWYGNDTCWRMVMDLNHIAKYGSADGKIYEQPQRELYSFADGIIGGQGNGPLSPEPLPMGILQFSNNPFLADVAIGHLWKLNIERIPLLKAAAKKLIPGTYSIEYNGDICSFEQLREWGVNVRLPPGWINYDHDAEINEI